VQSGFLGHLRVSAVRSADQDIIPAPRNCCAATGKATSRIVQAHFLSTRQPQRMFARRGQTVSEVIRHRRLERCRRDLLAAAPDPRSPRCACGGESATWRS
jgi:hypothetical protein